MKNPEETRISEQYQYQKKWFKWGPYVSDRAWGTVREDYSADGDTWEYTTHDSARSKAFRWGEEGIAAISDDKQILCLGLALWNGKDAILKERLFGLNNAEGNHGEDVKEIYYYLDSTPTHSYMEMLYKYPQTAFPYEQLLDESRKRSTDDPEFEIIETGIFDQDKYFDVFINYAKNDEADILIDYTVYNRSIAEAEIHLLPQIWFRNNWNREGSDPKPLISCIGDNELLLDAKALEEQYFCYVDGTPTFLFTDNETNNQRLYHTENISHYVKDGINDFIVKNDQNAINPAKTGTKVALHFKETLGAKQKKTFRLRLSNKQLKKPFEDFDQIFHLRKAEADEFYNTKHKTGISDDEKRMQRQAWAGLLWSKQFYSYNVHTWLKGDKGLTPPPIRLPERNSDWNHLIANDIILMPDKWEYPWFAAWDLAFHCIAMAAIDPDFAKQQLCLLVGDNYIHPNGELPAYEWNFSDANPPVHAMASYKVYMADKVAKGKGDLIFLEKIFQRLMINFTWWVNQKDSEGNNIFEGGFLGLDNIGIFNRSEPVPGGGFLEQADGTSWMAMYALNMFEISLELSLHNLVYEDMAIKFSQHFLYIAGSMSDMGGNGIGLWDDHDEFYYDMLRRPDGGSDRLRLRSLVGLIPLFAVIVFNDRDWEVLQKLKKQLTTFMLQRPDLARLVSHWTGKSGTNKHLFSLLRGHRMKMLLRRMLDTNEFLSDYGVRSMSRVYEEQPFSYALNNENYSVKYIPAESDSRMFGGNSNWRGPIWIPINYMLIESIRRFDEYYTDDFKVEYPTGSGNYLSLYDIADQLSLRLKSMFLKDENGERAIHGGQPKFNHDEHFMDNILFYEYFDGNNGKGLGASHQTGWTALIALL